MTEQIFRNGDGLDDIMKYFTATSPFHFSWDQVCIGFFQRYGLCKSSHILSEDVIYREVEGDRLVTRRLIKKTTPKITKVFFLSHFPTWTYVVEESIVDVKNKILTTYTRNIALQQLGTLDEKCVYKVNEACKDQVIQEKWAWIDSTYGKWAGLLRQIAYQTFKMRAGNSNGEFISALDKLFTKPGVGPSPSRKERFKEKAMKAGKMAQKAPKPVIP